MTVGLSGAGFDIDLATFAPREGVLARVLLDSGTRYIEHKDDMGCAGRWERGNATGNLYAEYSQPSGPSGIATTTADSYAWEYDERCWLIVPTRRMKALCRAAYKQGRTTRGGDRNNYPGVLLPIRWLIQPYVIDWREWDR